MELSLYLFVCFLPLFCFGLAWFGLGFFFFFFFFFFAFCFADVLGVGLCCSCSLVFLGIFLFGWLFGCFFLTDTHLFKCYSILTVYQYV